MENLDSSLPLYGAREYVLIGVAIIAGIVFLTSSIKLIFTEKRSKVEGKINSEGGVIATSNLTVIAMIGSIVFLGIVFGIYSTDANSQSHITEQWVYLGTGSNQKTWNFEFIPNAKRPTSGSVAIALRDVNIRESHFRTLTGIKEFFGISPPSIVGLVEKGECLKVIGFTSVGFNEVWMKVDPVTCPRKRSNVFLTLTNLEIIENRDKPKYGSTKAYLSVELGGRLIGYSEMPILNNTYKFDDGSTNDLNITLWLTGDLTELGKEDIVLRIYDADGDDRTKDGLGNWVLKPSGKRSDEDDLIGEMHSSIKMLLAQKNTTLRSEDIQLKNKTLQDNASIGIESVVY